MTAETRERLRQAVSDRRRELVKPPPKLETVAKRRRRQSGLAVVTKHGRSGYVSGGCRCDVCTDANRVYSRNLARARRARVAS